MTRSTILAATALLAGCGTPPVTGNAADNGAALNETTVEDVAPDGLAAPENMQFGGEGGNAN